MAQQNSSEEIDLGYILKKSNDFFKSVVRHLFLVIDFFKRFIIIIIGLLIIGFAYGYYKDVSKVDTYKNELIVIPNYGSVNYLYDKVEAIKVKIKFGDSLFLKQVLGDNFKDLKKVEIEPITDLYNFISQSRENIDIFRIITDKQNISEHLNDLSTSKYYKYHRMKFTIEGEEASKDIVESYMDYLNQNEHFLAYQKIFDETNGFQVEEYYTMIAQVDSLIKASTRNTTLASSVEINNTTDQHNLIEKKRSLVGSMMGLKMDQTDHVKPIKTVSADYNLKTGRFLSNKILYPLFLVFSFSLVFFILYLLKNLRRYASTK